MSFSSTTRDTSLYYTLPPPVRNTPARFNRLNTGSTILYNTRSHINAFELEFARHQGSRGIIPHSDGVNPPRSPPTALNSPIGVADILAEIFTWALPTYEERLDLNDWNKITPCNVAAVCRFWRNTALSHTTLWSTIKWIGTTSTHGGVCFPWEMFLTYLRRSGEAPLSLKLGPPFFKNMDLNRLLSTISEHQHHCKHVDISSVGWPYNQYTYITNSLVLKDTPFLDTLFLSFELEEVHVRLSDAPLLKTLTLDCRSGFSLQVDAPVLASLTSVTLYSKHPSQPSTQDCLTLLQASPALIHFSAHISDEGTVLTEGQNTETISIPSLTTFELKSYPSVSRHILRLLHLPGLQELTVGSCNPGRTQDALGVRALLSQSHADVEELKLECGIGEVAQCLGLSATLKALILTRLPNDEEQLRDLIALLTLKVGAQFLCPNLETIRFDDCYVLPMCAEELARMILSRWDPPKGSRYLRQVSFCHCDLAEGSALSMDARIARCRDEGLVLQFIEDLWAVMTGTTKTNLGTMTILETNFTAPRMTIALSLTWKQQRLL
ncbi:hypothetical protein DFH11DRAFT_1828655 [Phellopilus nigrolimitatus]|nr:hypothetical protein DFH11DRAFT_1828655 [Phellopilus nigrolimitatus]